MSILSVSSQDSQVSNAIVHPWCFASVIALLAVCGWVDYATGFDVSVFVLYGIPVAVASACMGFAAGLWSAVLAALIWVGCDVASGHVYAHSWTLYINAANRFVYFALCAVAASRLHLPSELKAASKQASAECTQCDRVRPAGSAWVTKGSYIEQGTQPERVVYKKLCPDCARRVYAMAGYKGKPSNPA
jgi:hypothetical protein